MTNQPQGELLPSKEVRTKWLRIIFLLHYRPRARNTFIGSGTLAKTKPLQKKKKRSCHIKVMIVDEHIGIQGNGNQDTQSWYHSQEINVMFDSALVCKGWIDGLRRNQNIHIYGEVSQEDGIWRDGNGNLAEDVIGVDPGKFSWAKGFMGAINRVRGTGGF